MEELREEHSSMMVKTSLLRENSIMDYLIDGRVLYQNKKWSELLTELKELHIDDWDQEYNDSDVMDGTQWSLDIEFSDDSEGIHIWGSNMFPNNFGDFLKVIEMRR